MAWVTSNRRSQLPKNWSQIVKKILHRDGHRCQYVGAYQEQCVDPATEVDHIDQNRNWDHSGNNLQALCEYHHAVKSSREGQEALQKKLERNDTLYRRREPDPGSTHLPSLRKTPRPPTANR